MYIKETVNTVKAFGAALFMLGSVLVIQACIVEVKEDTGSGFWAQDFTNNTFYRVTASLLAEGKYCKIWVEDSSLQYVNPDIAQKIASEYDDNIYGKMLDAFDDGEFPLKNKDGMTIVFNNILEYADWLTDEDGKLSILLLDIRDGYDYNGDSYTAGYFWSGNFYEAKKGSNSNGMDMIYLDTYPAEPGSKEAYQTLAHEMQHLMNFATSLLVRESSVDVWIDEGLSSAAEYIYLGEQVEERYEWFNKDKMGTIAKGNNFFVWGNLKDTPILDEYATVYLFFQWLRVQAGGTDIYKNIMRSKYSDYNAVTAAAETNISWFFQESTKSWESLFRPWLAANYINAASGRYGYNNDLTLKDVKAKTAPAGTKSLPLLPGEAVYSKTNTDGSTPAYDSSSPSIKYAGLKKGSDGTVSSDSTYKNGWLLTYNANDNKSEAWELGKLTGVADTSIIARSSSVGGSEERKPVRIDARDMLARKGHNSGAADE